MLNLTQHVATPEQIDAGVVDLPAGAQEVLRKLLTFTQLPTAQDLEQRADILARFALGYTPLITPTPPTSDPRDPPTTSDPRDPPTTSDPRNPPACVMIGGAPFFMAPLARVLRAYGLTPVFAFSHRVTEEVTLPDGSVRKTSEFRHAGFVPAI